MIQQDPQVANPLRHLEKFVDDGQLGELAPSVVSCVIRAMPISDSGVCRSPIPGHADHYFRSMPIAISE
jgi:hypothetical protein